MSTKNKKEDTTKKVVLSEEKKEELRNFNIKDIFAKTNKNLSSLLPTNLGTKKEHLYKKEIFEGMSDNEKKSYRKKIRNEVKRMFLGILSTKEDKEKQTKIINEFNDFYKSVFILNDYSFSSVSSENAKAENKKIILDALDIIKKATKK